MTCFRRKQTASTALVEKFLVDHPLHCTHCLGQHKYEVVPVISGTRMPYLDAETPRELVATRAKCALVLFKPFRSVQDIVDDAASDASWIAAYFAWEPTRSSFVTEIMSNLDDYYRASVLANEAGERSSNGLDLPDADSDELIGTRDEVDAAVIDMASYSGPPGSGRTDNFSRAFADADDASDAADSLSLPIFPTSATSSCACVLSVVNRGLLTATAESTARAASDLANHDRALGLSVEELQQWVKDSATDEAEPTPSTHPRNDRPGDVIELIHVALESSHSWKPQDRPQRNQSPVLRPYPSISDVSTAFTLNQKQHAAFSLIVSAMLRRIEQQERAAADGAAEYRSSDFESWLREDQLLMFLGGAGGTGKSRVIDAVDAFYSAWHRSDSIVKAALTGKAATLIAGRTLASLLVRLEHAIKEKKFAPLDLLVIDEISMMSKSEWLRLDKVLRRYKQIENVLFGGIHIVLVGDFLQLPPVKSDPVYLNPASKTKPSTADVEGFDLWRRVTTVVILDESVRFRSDPEWGEGCRNARLGRWTPEFVAMINARVMGADDAVANARLLHEEVRESAVFVTPENATRLAINNAFVAETALRLPTSVFPVRVVANFKGALNGLSQSDLRYVLSLPDNRFGRMAPYLDLVDGMPVQITQNVATAKGIANGTLGRLEYVHFPTGTQFRLVRDGATATVVKLPNHSPDYAVLRVPRPQATAIRPGADPELFPVFYATEAYSKTTIRLSSAPDGQPRTITVRPQQFPFFCAVGSTVYKVQGETLQSMVVMDWKSTQEVINKPQQTYLRVSRVTNRNGLIALAPLTAKLAAWSKPPAHALLEEERLIHLSHDTLARFRLPATADVAGRDGDGNLPMEHHESDSD